MPTACTPTPAEVIKVEYSQRAQAERRSQRKCPSQSSHPALLLTTGVTVRQCGVVPRRWPGYPRSVLSVWCLCCVYLCCVTVCCT